MNKNLFKKFAPINISLLQTQYIKGLGILLIIFHNFFHWVGPSTGENEFDFSNQRVFNFFNLIGKNPFDTINVIFSFLGHYGVQIFIFISGYGLAKSYISKKPKWKTFIIHRVSKIYPSLLVGIFVLVIFIILTKSALPSSGWWHQINLKLLMIHTLMPREALSINGPWWFYGLIFQLYLLFPLIYKTIERWNIIGFIIIMLISYLSIFTLIDILEAKDIYIMANAPGHLPEFALGVFLALRPNLQLNKLWLFIALIIFIIGNFTFQLYPFTFIAITFVMLIAILSYTKRKESSKFANNWIVKYGQLSMFVFAVHGYFRPPFTSMANNSDNALSAIWFAFLFFLTVTGVSIASESGYNQVSKLLKTINDRIIKPHINKVRNFFIKYNLTFTFGQFLKNWFYTSLAIISIRLLMMLWLRIEFSDGDNDYLYLLLGFLRESLAIARLTLWLIIPFLILAVWFKEIVKHILHIIYISYIILLSILSYYFLKTHIPLDDIISIFSISEILEIIKVSGGYNFWSLAFIILPSSLFILFLYNSKKIRLNNLLWVIILLSLYINHKWINPSNIRFDTDSQYYKAISYSSYLFGQISNSDSKDLLSKDLGFRGMSEKYHELNPEFNFTNRKFPFIHKNEYSDVLGDKFESFNEEKPNLVYIIVKNLGSYYSGCKAKGLSVTPFIDSLSNQSLYWPNCLSISNQNLNVLSGIFSSFNSFTKERNNMPAHSSLFQYLDLLNYNKSFYYGGNIDYNGMYQYLKINNVDLPLTNTDISQGTDSENPNNNWGWNDELLISNRILNNKIDENQAFIDVYLTLSSQAPYIYPDKEIWGNKLKTYLSIQEETNPVGKEYSEHIEELASVHFADNSLRNLFQIYKNSSVWENTIFIITGDQSFSNVPEINNIEKYNVPLLIYSPRLKIAETYPGIVSHFDITPSILAFISNQTETNFPNFSHWLGTGLDTSLDFSSNKKIAFIQNIDEIDNYLSYDLYLSGNRLFNISNNLKLTENIDTLKIIEIKKELKNLKNLNQLIIKHNKLLPQEFQSDRKSVQVFRKSVNNFDDSTTQIYFNKKNIITLNPINGNASAIIRNDLLYGSLAPNYLFSENYRQIEMTLDFDFLPYDFSQNKFPVVIFQIVNKNNNAVWYKGFNLDPTKLEYNENGVYHFSTNEILKLEKPIISSKLKVYIYNNKKNSLIYDNISFQLVGTP